MNYIQNPMQDMRNAIEAVLAIEDPIERERRRDELAGWMKELVVESYRNGLRAGRQMQPRMPIGRR